MNQQANVNELVTSLKWALRQIDHNSSAPGFSAMLAKAFTALDNAIANNLASLGAAPFEDHIEDEDGERAWESRFQGRDTEENGRRI